MKKCNICGTEHSRRKYCSEECRLQSKIITAKKWNKANKDKHAEHQRQHRDRDPVDFKNKEKQYYLNKIIEKPGYYVDKSARRNAAKKKAMPKWLSTEHKKQITVFYKTAARLTKITKIPHHVDHIEPLQGKISSGLHVPWNLQILTGSENSAKSNNENRKIVYMLCGQSGIGKTTLLKDYVNCFDVINYDGVTDDELHIRLHQSDNRIIMVDISIKISTFIKRYANIYFVRPIFIVESPTVVCDRIISRGGKTLNVVKRYNRIISLLKKYAYYSGNTDDVRCFLNGLKETT